jgi:hypothetical protein
MVGRAKWAATVDFKAYFYQFALHEDVRGFFTVRNQDGTTIRMMRLPMGFSWAVAIAQAFSKFVCAELKGVEFDVYVDNILLCSDDPRKGKEQLQALLSRCQKLGVIVGEVQEGCVVDHRGLRFELHSGTCMLKQSFIEKLTRRLSVNSQTWGEWRSLIGMVLYAAMARGVQLGRLYYVFKWWVRQIAKPLGEGGHVEKDPTTVGRYCSGSPEEWEGGACSDTQRQNCGGHGRLW